MTARPIATDPDSGIPDLVRRLADDSKRLVNDEVRLARIEARDGLHRATRGTLWLVLAFGVSVVMFTALTVFLATLIGRVANGHMWVGAIVTGVIELIGGWILVKRGVRIMAEPSYSFEASRAALADTANWAASARRKEPA